MGITHVIAVRDRARTTPRAAETTPLAVPGSAAGRDGRIGPAFEPRATGVVCLNRCIPHIRWANPRAPRAGFEPA